MRKINWKKFLREIQLLLIFIIGYDSINCLKEWKLLSILAGCIGLLLTFLMLVLRNLGEVENEKNKLEKNS